MTEKKLTTEEFAAVMGMKTQTVYKGVSQNGHFHGHVPSRALNGRLIWDNPQAKGDAK